MDGPSATSAPLSPSDPAAIGGYTLLGRLGTGGMGTVYLGSSDDDRLVAVKVVRREYSEDPDFTSRFHSEVEHAQAVASFCTAEVIGHGEAADGRPYMVTEFIPGTPLDRQISTYGKLEAATLHGVAFGVAAALTAIHSAGLVHRDLKPANVILSMSGPRVIDFGIARAVDATHGHTKTGEVVGTPGWWAPEHLQAHPVGPPADIFTWGCLVAYAGTGRHPFGEGPPMVLAHRILESEPDITGLPEGLAHLVRRALNRWPTNRPTAQELLLALVGGQTEQTTEAIEELWDPPQNLLPVTAPAPLPTLRRRRPPTAVLLVAGLVAVIAAGLVIGLRTGKQGVVTAGVPHARANDIGRRLEVGDVQLVVQRPTCRGAADAGQTCLVEWALLNMGGSKVDLAGPLDLVDDEGITRAAVGAVKDSPASIQPGDMISLATEYTLPADRRAVRLIGPVITGGGDIEVRL
ncbi:serine/threonine protein kinase [Planotetraspora silvatica]|nr:serine/threonine-protein kinase [Planotetraspora silvatica]